ncbi:hypothetical protein [Asticcacaulis sp. AND118]|uniref:hypothetical protein n=1 Tax=Asticcacaulis sp. AND118 TaxID=2840468 RepID=UPI001CFFFB5B|nr:hypothetical protein [Asticcacaulis sp. AND118]UDF02789.1 hypothetical protein LH365_10140 [Asticcacaulis sp. AND118]
MINPQTIPSDDADPRVDRENGRLTADNGRVFDVDPVNTLDDDEAEASQDPAEGGRDIDGFDEPKDRAGPT